MVEQLTNLTESFPNISSLQLIGMTNQSRGIYAFQITEMNSIDQPKPAFKYVSTIHGKRKTIKLSVKEMKQLCTIIK